VAKNNSGGLRNRLIGLFLLIGSIILIVTFSDSIVLPTKVLVRRLDVAQQLVPESIRLLKTFLLYFLLLAVAFSLFFLLDIYNNFKRFFGKYVDIDRIRLFFLKDRLCGKKFLPMFLLISGTFFGTVLQLFFLVNGEPNQEGFMEHISEVILLLAVIFLLISIFKVKSNPLFHDIWGKTILILLAISFVLFFIFGEEISWGERVIGFDSFGIFKEYNYQHETNLHNFFNPLFVLMYPLVGMSSFVLFSIFWFFKKNQSNLLDLLLPPPSLFFLLYIMACTTYIGHSEIYEELLYLFVLLYSIRILFCLSYPPMEACSQSQNDESAQFYKS